MDFKTAIQIIDDNNSCKENTFVYYLHEKFCFDEMSFWNLYNAIRTASLYTSEFELLSKPLSAKIFASYNYFVSSIISHLNVNDLYTISKLPNNFIEYQRRLEVTALAFYKGDVISDEDEEIYNKELDNKLPLILRS